MAIVCNASDIHLRSSVQMNLSNTTPFSVATWINAIWNPGSRRSFIGIYGPTLSSDPPLSAPTCAVQIGTAAGNGDLVCWTWGGGTLVGTAAGVMTTLNSQWVFIVYTFDGTNHRVYVNGTQSTTSTTAVTQTGFLSQIYINGYPTGGTGEVSNHQVDQYMLYRRTLSPEEIQTMWRSSGARHGIRNNLICHLEFDEAAEGSTASSTIDLTGNGHTLTPEGAGTPITYIYTGTAANANIRPVL